jgi:single-stranded-DNA-specific exonuclease
MTTGSPDESVEVDALASDPTKSTNPPQLASTSSDEAGVLSVRDVLPPPSAPPSFLLRPPETRPVVPAPASRAAEDLARALGLTITVADVLVRSGRTAGPETDAWLDPKLANLTPPDKMADREAFTDRVAFAVGRKERVAVFGDYDCDGITAAAIMTTIMRQLGAEAVPLLATRTEGAYGLSDPALARVKASGATLLVTCDCGSSDHERIVSARKAGIETVVIDHHLVPKEPLPALAFLNPHREDCGFPFKWLASCGLALNIGAALRKKLGRDLDLRPLLDLVAIGTIADVAPLVGDNRALVRAGLRVLASANRPGIRALAGVARMQLGMGVTSEDVSFRIAPRLNAPGRLGDPDDSLRLLLETDGNYADGLAATIEQVQLRRRALQAEMVEAALADIRDMGQGALFGLVLAREGWHPGVVGIVAGRIAETTRKPTIVIGLEGGTGRGSVRGPRGFPLHDALTLCKKELLGFGGHQAAAGVHVDAKRVDALRAAWHVACRDLAPSVAAGDGPVSVRLDPRDEPRDVVRDLAKLEPCGEGNPAPLLVLAGVTVLGARDLKGHLKLDLSLGSRTLSAIAFSEGARAVELAGKTCDVSGTLRASSYTGVELTVSRIS